MERSAEDYFKSAKSYENTVRAFIKRPHYNLEAVFSIGVISVETSLCGICTKLGIDEKNSSHIRQYVNVIMDKMVLPIQLIELLLVLEKRYRVCSIGGSDGKLKKSDITLLIKTFDLINEMSYSETVV